MDQKAIEELREKYIKNPPEGMTAKLVKNMSDSDLLTCIISLLKMKILTAKKKVFISTFSKYLPSFY